MPARRCGPLASDGHAAALSRPGKRDPEDSGCQQRHVTRHPSPLPTHLTETVPVQSRQALIVFHLGVCASPSRPGRRETRTAGRVPVVRVGSTGAAGACAGPARSRYPSQGLRGPFRVRYLQALSDSGTQRPFPSQGLRLSGPRRVRDSAAPAGLPSQGLSGPGRLAESGTQRPFPSQGLRGPFRVRARDSAALCESGTPSQRPFASQGLRGPFSSQGLRGLSESGTQRPFASQGLSGSFHAWSESGARPTATRMAPDPTPSPGTLLSPRLRRGRSAPAVTSRARPEKRPAPRVGPENRAHQPGHTARAYLPYPTRPSPGYTARRLRARDSGVSTR